MAEEKKDWITPVAIVGGVALTGLGLYFFMRKPPGIDPGDTFQAAFAFDYKGEPCGYTFQVWLGTWVSGSWFDHAEGYMWTKEEYLPGEGHYEVIVDCTIPETTRKQTYDAEAIIRLPSQQPLEYIEVVRTKGVVTVR